MNWEEIKTTEIEEHQKIIENLNNFITSQKDIDPEIAEIVNKQFWKLIDAY